MRLVLALPLIAAVAWVWATATDTEPQERAPGEFTLEELVNVSSTVEGSVPRWAPDGSAIAFTGRGRLWTISPDGGSPQALPVEGASQPQYSPDGRWLAYIARDGDHPEIWLWSVADREARRLTRLGSRIEAFSWSPGGQKIAFHSWRYGSPDVFTVDVPDGTIRRLTSDPLYEVYPTFTSDSRQVLFVRMDDRWVDHDIYVVDAEGGDARLVARDTDFFDYRRGQEFGPAQAQPGGGLVLFRSHRSGWLNYWVVPLGGGEPRPIWAEEADHNSQKPFRGYAEWSPDGRHIAFTSNVEGAHILRVVPAEGGEARTLVEPEMGLVSHLSWSPDARRISYTYDTPRTPQDLWVVDVEKAETRRLTHALDDPSLEDAFFMPERVSYESTDGYTIPSYLYRPPPSEGEGPFPAIVWIHGGPTSQFEAGWRRNWQAHYYVKNGYVVLEPNIRGSSGYGLDFELAARECWGRCDMEDVLAGVEYLETLPFVDPENMAVTGTSYGGYMSMAAAVFAPGVFRASIPTSSGYGDWIRGAEEFFAVAEVKLLEFEMGGSVEENCEIYRWTSPIFYVEDVQTPLLLVGEEGETPMKRFADQVARHYKSVRYIGMPSVGSPQSRLQWMPETLAFLDMHLKGREVLPSPADARRSRVP